MQHTIVRPTQSTIWRHHWPTNLVGFLGGIQLILTLIVTGLEATIITFDFQIVDDYGAITGLESRLNYPWGRYGLAAIFFYTITWISTFCVGKKRIN